MSMLTKLVCHALSATLALLIPIKAGILLSHILVLLKTMQYSLITLNRLAPHTQSFVFNTLARLD